LFIDHVTANRQLPEMLICVARRKKDHFGHVVPASGYRKKTGVFNTPVFFHFYIFTKEL